MADAARPTHEELIDLLVRKASSLRDAGILEVSLEGIGAKLAPAVPTWQPSKDDENDGEEETNPFASMPLPHLQIADVKPMK